MNWQSTFSLCRALLRILYPLSQAVTSKPDFEFWDTVYVFTGYRATMADLVLMVSSVVLTLQSEDLTWLGMFNKGPVKCSQDYKPMDSQYTLVPHCACIGYLSWLTCPLSVHLPSLTIWLLCITLFHWGPYEQTGTRIYKSYGGTFDSMTQHFLLAEDSTTCSG